VSRVLVRGRASSAVALRTCARLGRSSSQLKKSVLSLSPTSGTGIEGEVGGVMVPCTLFETPNITGVCTLALSHQVPLKLRDDTDQLIH
jgi:hypothetical protein